MDGFEQVTNVTEFVRHLERLNLKPGWVKDRQRIFTSEPDPVFKPAHWSYEACRKALDAATRLIDTEESERRVLILLNPVEGNRLSTARTMINAYQTILPGERARSHRHTSHALRVLIDTEGAYTVVDGERSPMDSGDVVLTPGGMWHSHGHEGEEQAYWLDGLDVPLTHLLEPVFFEPHPQGFEPVRVERDESPFRFTWQWTCRTLEQTAPDPEGHYGRRIRLEAPSMPTLGLYMQRLDSGEETRPFRSTANCVFCPLEGSGTSMIGDVRIDWRRGDVFVAPCWHRIVHRAGADAVLFSMSDEPLMRFAAYYRFEDLA